MATQDTPSYLGADHRQQILVREPQLWRAFEEADPTDSGFISKFDIRKALYVDAGLSYEGVSALMEDMPQSNGRVAYKLWLEAISSEQYPLRQMIKREQRADEELLEDVHRGVAASSDTLHRALGVFDEGQSGFCPLADFRRTLNTHLGLSAQHLSKLFQPLEGASGGFVKYSAWISSAVQGSKAATISHETQSSLALVPLVPLDRFYSDTGPSASNSQPLALPSEAVSRTAAMRQQMLSTPNASRLYGRGTAPAQQQLDTFRCVMRGTEQAGARVSLKQHALALQRAALHEELAGSYSNMLAAEQQRSEANHREELLTCAAREEAQHVLAGAPCPLAEQRLGQSEEALRELYFEKEALVQRRAARELEHRDAQYSMQQLQQPLGHTQLAAGYGAPHPGAFRQAHLAHLETLQGKPPQEIAHELKHMSDLYSPRSKLNLFHALRDSTLFPTTEAQ